MRTMRRGSHMKIMARMKRHAELMAKYEKEGMSRLAASQRAYEEIMDQGRAK